MDFETFNVCLSDKFNLPWQVATILIETIESDKGQIKSKELGRQDLYLKWDTDLKIKLVFGLRLTFCPDSSNKSEEGRQHSYKNIIFAKNANGYKQLIKIYTFAAQEGFYYEPRMDFKNLKPLWSNDLLLAIPFYDSFLYNNKYTDSQCVPDFSFTEPIFFAENNDVLFDRDMQKRVLDFCSNKYEIVRTKSIYYKDRKDFSAYLTFRCINGRTTVEKPNFDGMCSPEFCYESYLEAING